MGDRTCGRCYRNVVRQCETCPYCYTAYHPSCYRLKNCCAGSSKSYTHSGQSSLIQFGYNGYSSINLNSYSSRICGRCHKNVVRECRNCSQCNTPYHPSCYQLKKCCNEFTSNYNSLQKPRDQYESSSVLIDRHIGKICGRCYKNVVQESRNCSQCNTPYHPSCYELKRCCNELVTQKSLSPHNTDLVTATTTNTLRMCGKCHKNVVRECKNCSQCNQPYHPSCYQNKTCCRDGQKSETPKLLGEIFDKPRDLGSSASRICGKCHKNVVRKCENCTQCNKSYHPSCYQNKTCCRDGQRSETQKLSDIFENPINLERSTDRICGKCHKNVVRECKNCIQCNKSYHPSCYQNKTCCKNLSDNETKLVPKSVKKEFDCLQSRLCGRCHKNVARDYQNCTSCNQSYHPSCYTTKSCCKNLNENSKWIKSECEKCPFKVGLLNSRSMIKKFPAIQELVKEKNLSVFGVTETWLKEHHPDSSITIEGYNHYRCDRNRRGGGLILYVKNDLKCKQISLPSNIDRSEVQQLWCEIEHENKTGAIGLIYRPPGIDYKKLNYIHEAVEKISTRYDDVTVMGDFNVHYSNEKETRERALLRQLEADFKMAQLVEEPTRHAKNTATLLDHVYSNHPDTWKSVENIQNNFSDHNLIVFTSQY